MGAREVLKRTAIIGLEPGKAIGGMLLRRVGMPPLDDVADVWRNRWLAEIRRRRENANLTHDNTELGELATLRECVEELAPTSCDEFVATESDLRAEPDEKLVDEILFHHPPPQ